VPKVGDPDTALDAAGQEALWFREIVEKVPQIFYISDGAGRVLYVSPAFEAMSGYPVARVYEQPLFWFDLILPEDRARVAELMAKSRGTGSFSCEYRVVRADNDVRWLAARWIEVAHDDGTVHRVVGTATDITERRALEEQLRQAQKMEAVGQLAGGVAHDFNNLLTIITANAGLLRGAIGADEAAARQLADLQSAAQGAADLTRKLLGFSRQTVLSLRPVGLGQIVQEIAGLLRHTLDRRIEVRVQLQQGEAGDVVLADPAELSHVVMNLCLNARDAMPAGGVLTVETGQATIDEAHAARVPGASTGDFVYISIADTGEGISEEVLPHIYEPFFTTKPLGKGTGLGLAVAFGIVKQHQGFIQCSTRLDAGTRFTVYLPRFVAAQPTPQPQSSASPVASARGGQSILFVDDEAPIRTIARTVLERQGYRVRLAADGAEAVALFGEVGHETDLVIVDLTMPKLTGTEVVQKLRAARPDLRIILSTGHLSGDALALEGHPTIAVLHKPYTPDLLLQAVRRALEPS
jgi:PAS domain S-box-containing protein